MDIFFSHSRSRKIQTPKTKEGKKNGKVWSWYKTGMNEVNTEIEKQRPIQRRIRELVLYYISAGQTSLLQVQWSLHWLCLNLYGDNGILRNTGNT